MKPITDYRHFDYDPPAWRTNQRPTPRERYRVNWWAMLGLACCLVSAGVTIRLLLWAVGR